MSAPVDPNAAFAALYATTLRPRLEALEVRRRSAVTMLQWAAAPLAGIALLALLGFGENAALGYVVLGVAALVLVILFFGRQSNFRAAYKREIVGGVVAGFSPDLRYQPTGRISRTKFEAGCFFFSRIDRYSGEDLVAGHLDKTTFEFSELHAEYKTTTRTKNGTRTTWHTVFKGLYFIADFNKEFRTHVVALPDNLTGLFGGLATMLQKMNFVRGKLIKLEDPDFEQAFAVYGEDEVETRYILTPALMRRMLELRTKFPGRHHYAFIGSQVHLAVATGKNFFEPKIFASVVNLEAVRAFHNDLALITGIVEDLDLNTRIWTKA
jgi:hypothetical protein